MVSRLGHGRVRPMRPNRRLWFWLWLGLVAVAVVQLLACARSSVEPEACEWVWVRNQHQGTGMDSLQFCVTMQQGR